MRAWLKGFRQGFAAQLDFEASKIGVTPLAFRVLTALFWLAVFALLMPLAARAQVAGLCGPGKSCEVRTIRASTDALSRPASMCMLNTAQPGYSWGWFHSTSNVSFGAWFGNACSGTQATSVGQLNFNLNSSAIEAINTSYFSAARGYTASLAFASFPTAASASGRLIYDSTNSTWRYSNGTSWFPVGPYNLSDEFVIYFPGLSTLLNLPMSRWLAPRSIWLGGSYVSTFGTQIYSATTLVAGVGAGNAVFTIYNVSNAAATTATLTVPCAAAAGTVTASGSIDSSVVITTSAKTFELRLTTNGCTTLPTLNLNVRYTVLPPTN